MQSLWMILAEFIFSKPSGQGNTLVTANLQYSGVIFATLLGMLIWDDRPEAAGWFGMALIVASGMVATLRRPPPAGGGAAT